MENEREGREKKEQRRQASIFSHALDWALAHVDPWEREKLSSHWRDGRSSCIFVDPNVARAFFASDNVQVVRSVVQGQFNTYYSRVQAYSTEYVHGQ